MLCHNSCNLIRGSELIKMPLSGDSKYMNRKECNELCDSRCIPPMEPDAAFRTSHL